MSRITPTVGVYVSKYHTRKLRKHQSKFMRSSRYIRYIELAKAGRATQTVVFFFSTKDISLKKAKVSGTYYDFSENKWKERMYSYPNALFDKGGGGGLKAKKIRKTLLRKGVHKLNAQHYFNKWDLYKRLSTRGHMKKYLPYTVNGISYRHLSRLLQEQDKVYVKAAIGSCGKKVVRVRKIRGGSYQFSYFRKGKIVIKQQQTLGEVVKQLKALFQHHQAIVQHAIDLPVMNDSIVDMRSEVQRNRTGDLEVTGITVRVGRAHSPIASNTHASQYYPLDVYLQEHLHLNPLEMTNKKQKIHRFLLQVFRAVEVCYGRFGEMGIDFAEDRSGRLWLIECNAKSAKVALAKAHKENIINKAFQNPLEYVKYLISSKK